jgi:hypothetical protein
MGPRAGLDFMEKRKIPFLYLKSNPNYSVFEDVAQSPHPGNKAEQNM